jgi:hypothetical protein
MAIAQIIGGIVGLAIGAVIGALLIMLGSRFVMGKMATFPSAWVAAFTSAVVGFVVGLVMGYAIGAIAPNMLGSTQIVAGVIGFVATGPIYAALVKTNDGAKPTLVQAYILYVIQLAIALAVAFAVVTIFHIPLPGMATFGGQAG